jgi:arabinofuranosyltransferase
VLAGLVVVAAIGVFLIESVPHAAQIDDAYISFRYARNLVEGHGLVYNVGQRVEGFTNLLWVLLVALGMKLGGAAPRVSHWLGVSSGVALLVLSYAYARCLLHPKSVLLAALAPWLVLGSTSFAIWTVSGLETPLFSALVVAALVAQARGRQTTATAACVLATLTRPEGVLVAAVTLTADFAAGGDRRRRAMALAVGYAFSIAALTVFRVVYFGSALPNTFYAKVGGIPFSWTLWYLVTFVVQIALPLALAAALGARRSAVAIAGVAFAVVLFAYVALVGGDAFEHSRFFLPAVPVLVALALTGAECFGAEDRWSTRFAASSIPATAVWYLWGAAVGVVALGISAALAWMVMSRRNRLVVATAVAGAAGLAGAFLAPPAFAMMPEPALSKLVRLNRAAELSNVRSVEEYLDRAVQITATALAGQFPPPGRIAAVGIGLLGWYSRAEIVDLLGLVDPVIARSTPTDGGPMHFPGHQRGNAERVLSLAPDYILVPQTTSETDLPAVKELLNHPSLKERYEWDPVVSGFRKRLPLNLAGLRDRWGRRRHALATDRPRSRSR